MTTTPEPNTDLITELAELARSNGDGEAAPLIAAGTFAIYPSPGGGLVLVVDVAEAPNPQHLGKHVKRIPPAAMRAISAMGESASFGAMLKNAVTKRGKGNRG